MDYTSIERAADAFQQPVTSAQIQAMCQRAFGTDIQIEAAQELSGGLYNTTYLIHIQDMQPVILRVSPDLSRMARHEKFFLRNEYISQPFLAPLTPLLPRTLMADFTHQVLARDYLFSAFMEGEAWSRSNKAMTSEENRQVWRHLGRIAKTIHEITGPAFGYPSYGPQFPTWSDALLTWMDDIAYDLEAVHLDAADLRTVIELAHNHRAWLDEITSPRLLHGDLWLVNLLVKRDAPGPRIVAVLDSDRTFWGDPLADWTIFLLNRQPPAESVAFWETYGQLATSPAAEFRALVYRARYIGGIRLEQHRHQRPAAVVRSYEDMRLTLAALHTFL